MRFATHWSLLVILGVSVFACAEKRTHENPDTHNAAFAVFVATGDKKYLTFKIDLSWRFARNGTSPPRAGSRVEDVVAAKLRNIVAASTVADLLDQTTITCLRGVTISDTPKHSGVLAARVQDAANETLMQMQLDISHLRIRATECENEKSL